MAGEVQAQKLKLVVNPVLKQRPFIAWSPAMPAEHTLKE